MATPLRARIQGQDPVVVEGGTAGDVLRRIEREHGALKGWMLDERGRLRDHVSVFVNDRRVSSLDHPVADGDEVYALHAISGG